MAIPSEPERDALTAELEERRRVEESLRAQVAEHESLLKTEQAARMDAERMAEHLFATLCHELRSPIQAVLGWVRILQRNPGPEDTKLGLETIERNSLAQARLISDLIDMSWIVAGKLRLDVQPIDYEKIVNEAIATVHAAAVARNISIDKNLDPLTGLVPRGDPARLQQVVWNLLDNAVKFTPDGGGIRISLERVSSHVELRVADTGVGIEQDLLAHVFERFRSVEAGAKSRYGGLGIGLAIVKSIVEAHGGSIRVESAGEGKGTTFIVELPLTVSAAAEKAPPRELPRDEVRPHRRQTR